MDILTEQFVRLWHQRGATASAAECILGVIPDEQSELTQRLRRRFAPSGAPWAPPGAVDALPEILVTAEDVLLGVSVGLTFFGDSAERLMPHEQRRTDTADGVVVPAAAWFNQVFYISATDEQRAAAQGMEGATPLLGLHFNYGDNAVDDEAGLFGRTLFYVFTAGPEEKPAREARGTHLRTQGDAEPDDEQVLVGLRAALQSGLPMHSAGLPLYHVDLHVNWQPMVEEVAMDGGLEIPVGAAQDVAARRDAFLQRRAGRGQPHPEVDITYYAPAVDVPFTAAQLAAFCGEAEGLESEIVLPDSPLEPPFDPVQVPPEDRDTAAQEAWERYEAQVANIRVHTFVATVGTALVGFAQWIDWRPLQSFRGRDWRKYNADADLNIFCTLPPADSGIPRRRGLGQALARRVRASMDASDPPIENAISVVANGFDNQASINALRSGAGFAINVHENRRFVLNAERVFIARFAGPMMNAMRGRDGLNPAELSLKVRGQSRARGEDLDMFMDEFFNRVIAYDSVPDFAGARDVYDDFPEELDDENAMESEQWAWWFHFTSLVRAVGDQAEVEDALKHRYPFLARFRQNGNADLLWWNSGPKERAAYGRVGQGLPATAQDGDAGPDPDAREEAGAEDIGSGEESEGEESEEEPLDVEEPERWAIIMTIRRLRYNPRGPSGAELIRRAQERLARRKRKLDELDDARERQRQRVEADEAEVRRLGGVVPAN